MEERRYKVLIDNMVVSERMDLKTAIILVKALFDEYYNDHKMIICFNKWQEKHDAI